MAETLRLIVRGLGTLPEYGPHPGIPTFFILAASGFLFGWFPGVVSTAIWGTALCWGAYDRAADLERVYGR